MIDFKVATPILNVKNLRESIDYYVQKLGFEKLWDWGDPPDFGCVARGKVEIFLCQGCQGQPGMWMSIFMDDVDALYEEYKKKRRHHSGPTDRLSVANSRNASRRPRRAPVSYEWATERGGS